MNGSNSFKIALLRIVAHGCGRYGWHEIGVHLSTLEVPRDQDMLATLKGLTKQGLLRETRRRWEITQTGEALLSPELDLELVELAEILSNDLAGMVEGLRHRVDSPKLLIAQLRRLKELDLGFHDGIAFAASIIAEPERTTLLMELSQADSVEMRRAIYRLWAPLRLFHPGRGLVQLPQPHWDRLIRDGLNDRDADLEIRTMAAGLAFDTKGGAAVHAELIATASHADSHLRCAALLALASAEDSESLALLQRRAKGSDLPSAKCAVRALAARVDGHESALEALDDSRHEVREAARFGLSGDST